ncbi:Ig-like domain-containing protein [Patescibacteria group bacterium]
MNSFLKNNFKIICFIVFLSVFSFSIFIDYSSAQGKGGGQEVNLVLSHIECAEEQGQVEFHFVVNHLDKDASDFGTVSYTVNSQNFTADFDKLTGKTAHYLSYISYTSSSYDVSSASVTVEGEALTLHNLQNKELSCQTEVDLSISKTVDNASPSAGDTITYTITVQNNSSFGTENVIAEDQLPAGITYQSHSTSQGSYDQGSGAWNIGQLNDSSSATLDITVLVDDSSAGMDIENVGSVVSSDTPDSSLENNYDDALITISFIAPVAHDDDYSVDEDEILHIDAPGPLSNDEHIDQGAITAVIANHPSHGEITFHDSGEFTYTPAEDYNGTDSFTYEVCGDHSLCNTATVAITINSVNDAPVASGDLATTVEGQPVTINVIHDDHDVDDNLDPSSVSIVDLPTNGIAVPNTDGTVVYTPNDGFVGTDIFTYSVCDTEGLCSEVSSEVSVLVLSEEGASLIAVGDLTTIDEGSSAIISVLLNDIYTGEGELYLDSILESPTHGEITINEGGTITYTPEEDFFGTDYFTYVVCDNLDPQICAESDEGTITVNGVNDAPIANDDVVAIEENETIVIHVTHDDIDMDNNLDETSLSLESSPSSGTAEAHIDGTISYTPHKDYTGSDEFMYKICDEGEMCDTARVSVSIIGAVHAPTANNDYISVIGSESVQINVLENDESESGNLYVDRILNDALFGTSVLNGDNTITYTPNEEYYGEDEIVYIACSEPDVCAQAEIFITVSEMNHAPEAHDDIASTFKNETVVINVIHDDIDVDNNIDPSSVSITSGVMNGRLTENDDGTISYTPDPGFGGTDTFKYKVCDTDGLCSEVHATVEVSVIEKPKTNTSGSGGGGGGSSIVVPIGIDDEGSVFRHEVLLVDPLANDLPLNSSYLFVSRISYEPLYGTVEINEDNTISYFPDGEYVGVDRFDYVVCDSRVSRLCSDAEVVVTVSEDDTAPIAQDDFVSVHENGSAEIDVLIDDFDLEKNIDTETLKIISFPTNGTAKITDSGIIMYTANENFVGLDGLEYLVCDTEDKCDTATVTFDVFAGNHLLDAEGHKECEDYLKKYIKIGAENDYEEVKKMQKFLIFYENRMDADMNGIFDQHHCDIVLEFQSKYAEDILEPWGLEKPTGYVYETTIKKINELYCFASCRPYLTDFIKYRGQNDANQVKKLQKFLKDYEGHEGVVETGIYDKITYDAVLNFQKKYSKDILGYWSLAQPTGYVYKTTVKKINELYCKNK